MDVLLTVQILRYEGMSRNGEQARMQVRSYASITFEDLFISKGWEVRRSYGRLCWEALYLLPSTFFEVQYIGFERFARPIQKWCQPMALRSSY